MVFMISTDKVILIDTDTEICYQRLMNRDKGNQHNFNRINIEKMKVRRQIYLDCAKKYIPEDKLVIINNNQSFEKSSKDILEAIKD